MTQEEHYVKYIESGIRAIKLGTKKPHETNVSKFFEKLRDVNDGLCDDLMERYKQVVEDYNKRENQKLFKKSW